MTGGTHDAILVAGGTTAFAGLAGLALWVLPAPHQPFHYLLAGTLATAVTLAAMLVLASLRGAFLGIPGGAAGRACSAPTPSPRRARACLARSVRVQIKRSKT